MWTENTTHRNFGMSYLTNPYRYVIPCVDATYENLPSETLVGRVLGQGGNRLGMGFRPDSGHVMYESLVKSVKAKLDNDNVSPTQTISARVRDSSGGLVDTFGTLDATTLTSSPVEYTFNTTEIQMSADDFITVEYDFVAPQVQARVYRTATAGNIANANTLVSTSSITSWAGFYDYDWFYVWLECDYCS